MKVAQEVRQETAYPLKDIFKVMKLSKSVYYYWIRHMNTQEEKEQSLVDSIRMIFESSRGRYGYRRIQAVLKQQGIIINHKRLLRLMRKYGMHCQKFVNKSRRKYSAYRGTVGRVVPNKVQRQFNVDGVNQLWLTDVTEFALPIPGSRLYLSTVMDAYNSEIISYRVSRTPNLDIALVPIKEALERADAPMHNLTFHSDQGYQYQHRSIVELLKAHNVSQSMSRKGNCLDNAPMENLFGLLKQEMFYGERFESYEVLEKEIHAYVEFYNHQRIKTKLKGMSPVQYREHALESA